MSFNFSHQNITANLTLYYSMDNPLRIPATLDIGLEKPLLDNGKNNKLSVLLFVCLLSSVQPPFSLIDKTFTVLIQNSSINATASQTIIH
jgi:hypothetical protein